MQIITTTDALERFIADAMQADFVTIDTEFLRERTYFAQLCLIQMAYPGDGETDAVLIDPLADGLSLEPLKALCRDRSTVKVFHAARQDLEIFWHELGLLPEPLFDTQVAAMVCGFGDQVGYETLVKKLARADLDKSSRFTDWSRRPLSEAQLTYALADVTHLRVIYLALREMLDASARGPWVEEEIRVLRDPETYIVRPEEAWQRVKMRGGNPRFIAAVKALAAFREAYAQARNTPRSRVFKDDALLELASLMPKNVDELSRARLLLREARKGAVADGILKVVAEVAALPKDRLPKIARPTQSPQVDPALADLLRVLLKAKSEETGVAARLIASTSDLDMIAAGERDLAAMRGWRQEVFGADATRLCDGETALYADNGSVRLVTLPKT